MNSRPNLIFDLGLHKGYDAKNYLAKGFDVVGVEAIASLCESAKSLNAEAYASGRLKIVNRALFDRADETVTFFVNPEHEDWGSLEQGAAEKGVSSSYEIKVETTTLEKLYAEFGLPYYIKCDLEGGDRIFASQLSHSAHRPSFISIEATSADDLAHVRAAGYTHFQIVNQYLNPWAKPPTPSREGLYNKVTFTHEMSGLFGRELDPAKWWDFSKMLRAFVAWHDLHSISHDLAVGWLDVHATTEDMIA